MKLTPEQFQETRRLILAAAERVFAARGYSAATMDAIAAEAGISKGSIYNYFKSKQEVFGQIFAGLRLLDDPALEALFTAPLPPVERIHRLLDEWFNRLEHFTQVGRIVLEYWAGAMHQTGADAAAPFRRGYEQRHGWLAALLREGQARGDFIAGLDTRIEATLILSIVDGLTIQAVLGLTKVDQGMLSAMKRGMVAAISVSAAPAAHAGSASSDQPGRARA